VRAGNGSESKNQGNERRTGGKSIGQESQGGVAHRQILGHDSGAYDGSKQKTSTQSFGSCSFGKGHGRTSVGISLGANVNDLS
jgi:hypothetical protein